MRYLALVLSLVVGCAGDPDVPTATELYGTWSSTDAGVTREFVFSAPDAYTLANMGAIVQTGTYSIEKRPVTGHGTTDALVTQPATGPGAGSTFGNAILDWDGSMMLTLSSENAASGQLVYSRR
jgi:hypothetical protein